MKTKLTQLQTDILVAGGGPAGVSCALAAARCGAKVILCQDRPVLGGNASSEVRMHIVGANGMSEGIPLQCEAREGGIVEEIRLNQCVRNPQRSPSMMDLGLYDLCRQEPSLTLMLNTTVTQAQVVDNRIQSVTAERPSTHDRFEIRSEVYVDCTGDGALGYAAGAAFSMGREAQAEYSESFAPDKEDRKTLGSTLLFQARKHSRPMPFSPPSWARKFSAESLKHRPFGQPGLDLNLEFGFWWLEWGGELDTIKDNEIIRGELLAALLGVWDFIKNHSNVDAENWALEWCGFLPGKRESRRFHGQYRLCEGDLMQSKFFQDAIATGGWPIDTHPPGGIDAVDEHPCNQIPLPYLFDIPLRSCIARDLDNLMFAGRNISATHIAFASTRVMATCSAIGQGVGTAAAYGIANAVKVSTLPTDSIAMQRIRQQLIKDDAFLLGCRNEDSRDLASRAIITASSEQPGGPVSAVTDGWTRALRNPSSKRGAGPIGAPPDRWPDGTHRWMSDQADGLPAWICFSWSNPVSISSIELVFDTGMHRLLTLSMADGYTQRMLWGKPQPETVRGYVIEAEVNGQWLPIHRENCNYQRRQNHQLETPVVTSNLRIQILETNGMDHARLFEVRIYPPDACGPFLQ
ncbi:MAG: FAD-dependent oxidoreductase [Verrucomicrobia bacterium]|nr:FAD-dependent oxidoreductase [Verrucomicrobiota bacterium]